MRSLLTATIILVLTCVGLFAVTPAARADGCYTSYNYPTYSYPSYYYPQTVYKNVYVDRYIAVPQPYTVAVPVVSYLWNGGGLGYAPVYQAQPANPGMSVQTKTTETQASTFTDAQIDALIDRIEKRLEQRRAAQPANREPPPSKELPPPAPGPSSSLDARIKGIFVVKRGEANKSCIDCHNPTVSKGGLALVKANGALNDKVDWDEVWSRTDKGTMPPEAKEHKEVALSDQDVDLIHVKRRQVSRRSMVQ